MIQVRKAQARGHARHGWLESYHTFSFAGYYDPQHMGFADLRVINEDRVQPRRGFGEHSHRDMEIVSYVLSGELQHRDSLGNGSVIRPGDVQRMSAGTGVTHSEFNPSERELVHFLQIWLLPERDGIEPSWEQKHFPAESRRGKLALVASRDARDGSLRVHQDVDLYASLLEPGERVEHALRPGRSAWLQLARGRCTLNGTSLEAGDGAAVSGETKLVIDNAAGAELLLFDLV
jgi:redox-sensitive bicupin YhaK (pirin superfamily)